METLDRLSQRLTMAGLRLASLRRRLAGVEDRMMLIQASDDLDEAIAEVRRIALSARGSQHP
jgi:signal transduction histidine kinase